MLTELMLQRAGLEPRNVNGFDDTEITHSAVAAFIASGMADAGIGVQTAAQRFGLPFIPLLRERYYLAVATAALAEEPVASAVRRAGRSGDARAHRGAGRLRGCRNRARADARRGLRLSRSPGDPDEAGGRPDRQPAQGARGAGQGRSARTGATGRNRTCA